MESGAEILEIFPNEVWEEILSHVKTAADYQSVSNASPHFRTLLLPRAPELLFLEVVKPYMAREGKSPSSWTPLRGACRSWKELVDQELQREQLYSKRDEICDTKAVIEPTFSSAQDLTRFEEHFDPTHFENGAAAINPFVCRAIKIRLERDFYDDHPAGPFYVFRRFLEKYGEHVWSCEIEEDVCPVDPLLDYYVCHLSRILNGMPNLRSLQLTATPRHACFYSLDMDRGTEQDMDRYPFPTLRHLSQIELRCAPSEVVTRLLDRNPQVSKIADRQILHVQVAEYLRRLPNLSAVAFSFYTNGAFEQLLEWQANCQSVEYLWLNARYVKGVTRQTLFHVLETCFGSSSLSKLVLALPEAEATEDLELSLTLPKLKTLHLSFLNHKASLQFIRPMKDTLEQLGLGIETESELEEDDDEGEKDVANDIRLLQAWKEPHKSNIWATFSKLRLVQTGLMRGGRRYSGTRTQWKQWQKERTDKLDLKSDKNEN